MIYLDYAAATPLDHLVLDEMQPYLRDVFFNPSADYQAARGVRRSLNEARAQVAQVLGAKPSEIIFTAGGSEANNLAIKGVLTSYPGSKVLVSAIEHESILAPAEEFSNLIISVEPDGRISMEKLISLVDDETVLVSVMYANNEIGTIEPIKKISEALDRIKIERLKNGHKLPILLHTDACQAANYLDLHVSRLGVDLMTLNGGKIYGPKQSGALYVRAGVLLKPQINGGGQEFGLRSGTENVASSIGFSTALVKTQSIRAVESERLSKLREYFIKELEYNIKNVVINGSRKYRLPNNVHATFLGQDNERLLIGLDQIGIMAASGSACSASKEESSHVLMALGLSDEDARSSLRFSLGRSTNKKDVDATVSALKTLVS